MTGRSPFREESRGAGLFVFIPYWGTMAETYSYSEQLADVQAAIRDILRLGQRVGERERGRLDTLLREEKRLRRAVSRQKRGGIRRFQAVPRG